MMQFFTLFTFLILTACSISKETAPIEYHHNQKPKVIDFSSAQSSSQGQIIDYDDNIVQPQEIAVPIHQEQKIIYHEVKLEETIEDIAEQYGQPVADIAKLNNLTPPYDISEYQILKLYDKQPIIKENDMPAVIKPLNPLEPNIEPNNQNDAEFIQPVKGKVISKFGDKTNLGPNKGINIAAQEGAEIFASSAGKVVYSNYDATYGNLVIIKLDQSNIFLTYAHLKSTELGAGDHVSKGEVIGFVGSTGKVSSPQLHFGIRDGKLPKDPTKYVKY